MSYFKKLSTFLITVVLLFSTGCGETEQKTITVFNWGDYLNEELLDDFEAETGIRVIYDTFASNEDMWAKFYTSANSYDVVIPSDYMIERMIKNDLILPLDHEKLPNLANLYPEFSKLRYDPGNHYSAPYFWSSTGIIYNTAKVKEPVDSWNILWDKKYKDDILMQASVRDAFMVSLSRNGNSINSVDNKELQQARDELIKQKPIVQAYVIDQVRDKMIGEEAALGVIYSGEALFTKTANPNLEYVIPKEGSNIWMDSWVIPKSAKNVSGAEKFLDFLCDAEVAYKNFKYLTYSTPNKAAKKLVKDNAILNNIAAFPTEEQLKNCNTFKYLGKKNEALYVKYWNEVQAYN